MHPALRFVLSPVLLVGTLVYRVGLSFDRDRKRQNAVRLPRPVVSIGNLSWGGTGKTPILMRALQDFASRGWSAGVLSRGYRGLVERASTPQIVLGSTGLRGNVNDEARLVAERFPDVPIAVGSDRVASASTLVQSHNVDVFLLDDGFQHWVLERNLDIVCVDATDPWGQGLLPLGRLREPLSALKRASLIVLTRTEQVDDRTLVGIERRLTKESEGRPIARCAFQSSLKGWNGRGVSVEDLRSRTVVALSAIGHPASFERLVARWWGRVLPMRFSDHHEYNEADSKKVEQALTSGKDLVMTDKDRVKMVASGWIKRISRPDRVFVLSVEPVFDKAGEQRWNAALSTISKS